jgi:hypothetical protein
MNTYGLGDPARNVARLEVTTLDINVPPPTFGVHRHRCVRHHPRR